MQDTDIGRQVRDRRLQLDYPSQVAAAQAAGIGLDTWGKLERGIVPKTASVRRKVARVLRWPVEVFEGAKPEEDPKTPDPAVLRRIGQMEQSLEEVVRVTAGVANDVSALRRMVEEMAQERAAR